MLLVSDPSAATPGLLASPWLSNVNFDRADAIDAAGHGVARTNRADTGRGAGEDEVARLQFHRLAAGRHDVGDRPDQFGKIGVLPDLAVHGEPDAPRLRVP